ncbi:hypothetical protein GCK32_013208, partial [Trichostrongylus colubriformis]
VSMVVERGVALWKRRCYETYGPQFAKVAIVVSIVISCLAVLMVTRGITQTLPTSYCILNGIATPQSVMILKLIICAVDVLTLMAIAVLFILNKILVKRKTFDLQSSYQLLENSTLIRIISPLAIFQTLFYISFSVSGAVISLLHQEMDRVTYVSLTSATYSIPFYTMLSPILMWLTIGWSQQLNETKLRKLTKPTVSENEAYFQSYKEMWGKPRAAR